MLTLQKIIETVEPNQKTIGNMVHYLRKIGLNWKKQDKWRYISSPSSKFSFLRSILMAVDPEFKKMSETSKEDIISEVILQLAHQYDILYKKFCYKKGRKQVLNTFESGIETDDIIRLYVDYFAINIYVLEGKYIKSYLVGKEHPTMYFNIKNGVYSALFENEKSIFEYSEYYAKLGHKYSIAKTLKDYQELAEEFGIIIQKDGKNKLVNKTKQELIDALRE